MPTKNRVKVYVEDTYYHLYNRGWNRTEIFKEDEDYEYFEWLLARHLDKTVWIKRSDPEIFMDKTV